MLFNMVVIHHIGATTKKRAETLFGHNSFINAADGGNDFLILLH